MSLFVQRSDGLRASNLATARRHFTVSHVPIDGANDVFAHRPTEVALSNDAISLELIVGVNGTSPPAIGAQLACSVGKNVAEPVYAKTGDNDADAVTGIRRTARAGGIALPDFGAFVSLGMKGCLLSPQLRNPLPNPIKGSSFRYEYGEALVMLDLAV